MIDKIHQTTDKNYSIINENINLFPREINIYLNAFLEFVDSEVRPLDMNLENIASKSMGLKYIIGDLQVFCFVKLENLDEEDNKNYFYSALILEAMNMLGDHLAINMASSKKLTDTFNTDILRGEITDPLSYAKYTLITQEEEFDCHIFLQNKEVSL